MKMMAALDLAIQIEEKFYECYVAIRHNFPDETMDVELEKLAVEEVGHKNLLKTGKNYLLRAPQAFPEEIDLEPELQSGRDDLSALQNDLQTESLDLRTALERIYKLELKFEQVHLQTLAQVTDNSLKQLFEALSAGDKEHRERLGSMMASHDINTMGAD